MEDEVRPLRVWNEGVLREYDTVTTVGGRRIGLVRSPRLASRPWALPGGFSDQEEWPGRNEKPQLEAGAE
jgi:ADP-ribose pyrophosphatase YjhB (NUDIX family)